MESSIGKNTTPSNPWGIPPAQSTPIESQPITPPVANAGNMVTDAAKDLFRADPNSGKKPPQPNETTGLVGRLRNLTKLGINNILVPMAKEIFKRNAELALQSPKLTPEERAKIEAAKYTSAAVFTQGTVSFVTQEVHKRIIQVSTGYKLRPNALRLSLEIVTLIEKYGGL